MLQCGSPHVAEGPNSAAQVQALSAVRGTLMHPAWLRHRHVSVLFRCCRHARASQMARGTCTQALTCTLGVQSLAITDGLLVLHPQDCILGSREVVWAFWHPCNLLPVLGVRILSQMLSSCVGGHNFELAHCSCQRIAAKCCPAVILTLCPVLNCWIPISK